MNGVQVEQYVVGEGEGLVPIENHFIELFLIIRNKGTSAHEKFVSVQLAGEFQLRYRAKKATRPRRLGVYHNAPNEHVCPLKLTR